MVVVMMTQKILRKLVSILEDGDTEKWPMKQVPGMADASISAIYFLDICHPVQSLGAASVPVLLLIPASF